MTVLVRSVGCALGGAGTGVDGNEGAGTGSCADTAGAGAAEIEQPKARLASIGCIQSYD